MSSLRENIASAINAFFAVSYVPLVIPIMLSVLKIPNTWLVTCLIIALMSSIASFISNKAMIAGPSIASIAILTTKILPESNINELMFIVFAASLILIALVFFGAHRSLLNVISDEIKLGFKAGIGLMFIVTAVNLINYSNYQEFLPFIIISIIFWICKERKYVTPIICLIITFLNISGISTIGYSHIIMHHEQILWNINLLSNIIMLVMTMLIDGTITANTLNPSNEHRSLYLSSISSLFTAIILVAPASIYLESLVFANRNKAPAMINALFFLLIGIMGSSIHIPSYLAASLLGQLGLQIITSTNPRAWLLSKPKPAVICILVGIIKSFIYGIFAGIILEKFLQHGTSKEKNIWLIILLSTIMLINFT